MTVKSEMKLHGTAGSAFATRIKLALKFKSIEYEYFEENLCHKSEPLLTGNPVFQRVPVLFHNQQPLIESLVIMEYLDEIRPDVHPLLPSDPFERAQCRNVAYIFDTLCYPWMKEFMLTRDDERREELKRLLIGGSVMLEEAFVKLSKGKAFFGGDDIGYLDVVVGGFLGWVKFYGVVFGFHMIEEPRTPGLAQWEKTMWSHKVAASIFPTHQDLRKFLDMLVARLPPLPFPVSA